MAKVTLKTLVDATRSETGFMYATEKDVAELVKHGFAELNRTVVSECGKKFGVRASESGLAAHDNAVAKETAVDEEVEEVEGGKRRRMTKKRRGSKKRCTRKRCKSKKHHH